MTFVTNPGFYIEREKAQAELNALSATISALNHQIETDRKNAREHQKNACLDIAVAATIVFTEVACTYHTGVSIDRSINKIINLIVPNDHSPLTTMGTIAMIFAVKNFALSMWKIKKKESKLAEVEALKEKYNEDQRAFNEKFTFMNYKLGSNGGEALKTWNFLQKYSSTR